MLRHDSQLSFKNVVTATTLSSHFIPLHTMNQELATIPLMSTDYWIHPLPHLQFWSTFPLEHDPHPSLLLVLCAVDMVTRLLSVFGMALAFVLTAKKLGIPYTIATSCIMTNSNSTLICCIVQRVNNQDIPRLIAALYHLTSNEFSSLVSLRANRGVML